MADRIVDLLTLAGVLALMALPVAMMVIGALAVSNTRRARLIKDLALRHGDLKRRLSDVEALRSRRKAPGVDLEREAVPPIIREHLGDFGWHDEYGRERG